MSAADHDADFYTCPTECVETNHPGMEHRHWLSREDEDRVMGLIELVRPYWDIPPAETGGAS